MASPAENDHFYGGILAILQAIIEGYILKGITLKNINTIEDLK